LINFRSNIYKCKILRLLENGIYQILGSHLTVKGIIDGDCAGKRSKWHRH